MAELYQISFPNGKSYIGVTSATATARFAEHAYNSRRADRGRAIERAIRKYGANAAIVKTLVIGAWEYLLGLEKSAILAFGTFGRGGYNMTAGGEGALGYKHTPESLKKMGAVHEGKAHHTQPHTPEAKAKMRAAALGRIVSPETRTKISAASRGNKHNIGRRASPESRARMAAAQLGKRRTPEQRANISRAASLRESARKLRRSANGR